MQSVNQPCVYNLKPLFAALEAVRGWSELVLITWKKAGIQVEKLNEHAVWARDHNYGGGYIDGGYRGYQNARLSSKEEALKNCGRDIIKKVHLHIDEATDWNNWELFAPVWCGIKQALATEKKVKDEAVSEAAKNVPDNAAFHFHIKPLLEKVVVAVDATKILSSVLEATRRMTLFWISVVESIGQLQMTELFQLRSSAAVLEIEKMTSIAERVMSAAKDTALDTAQMEQLNGSVVNVAHMSMMEIEEALVLMDRLRSTTIPMFISTCETITLQTLPYATDSHTQ
jgi:hypothetical protein